MAASYCRMVVCISMGAKSNEIPLIRYSSNGKNLSFERPQIMAIVNLTPDSFYDGGKYSNVRDVLSDAESKISQGAEMIDIGAASSRPGAVEIPEAEEWRRLEPVLIELRKSFPAVFISVDTYRATIAERCANLGADIINDISGGKMDRLMFGVVAKTGMIYVLMHLDGTPQTMKENKPYEDVVGAVLQDLKKAVSLLESSGCRQIIIDPGFGFGKSLANNYELLKHIPSLLVLGYPLLAGISRKSMINKVISTNPVSALNGTTVLNTIALLNGASILRVHDVAEARQAIDLVEYYRNA